MMSLGQSILAVRAAEQGSENQKALLKEASAKASKMIPLLQDISQHSTTREWSPRIVFAFSTLCRVSAVELLGDLGFSATMDALKQIENDMVMFPDGKQVHF